MRLVTYGVACSLDGFLARPDGSVDWLEFTDDARAIMQAFWPRIDTILMGRKTYEVALANGGGGDADGGVATYVFSRTLAALPRPGAQLVREDAGAFVRKLKQTPGKDICVMGGGDFLRSLIAADVVDEISLNVHPVLLGSGIPHLLDPRRQVDLELTECRALAKGCALLTYRVVHTSDRPPKGTRAQPRHRS